MQVQTSVTLIAALRSAMLFSLLLDLSACRRIVLNSQAANWFSAPQQVEMARAIEAEDTGKIKSLLESGTVKPNEYGLVHHYDEQPISFLEFAVMAKAPASIAALLQAGADVNFHTPDGWSAVAEAADRGDTSTLKQLLDAGADINTVAGPKRSITILAFMNGKTDNYRLLLNRGADINAEDATGDTLVVIAANLNQYSDTLYMLDHGADPSRVTRGKTNLLAYAVQHAAGRLTPDFEQQRQKVIQVLKAKGITFPQPEPPMWDMKHGRYFPQ